MTQRIIASSLLGGLLLALILLPGAANANTSGVGHDCGVLKMKNGDQVRRFDIVRSPKTTCLIAKNLTRRIENGARGWKRNPDGSLSKRKWICEEVGKAGYCRNDRNFATIGWTPHRRSNRVLPPDGQNFCRSTGPVKGVAGVYNLYTTKVTCPAARHLVKRYHAKYDPSGDLRQNARGFRCRGKLFPGRNGMWVNCQKHHGSRQVKWLVQFYAVAG